MRATRLICMFSAEQSSKKVPAFSPTIWGAVSVQGLGPGECGVLGAESC